MCIFLKRKKLQQLMLGQFWTQLGLSWCEKKNLHWFKVHWLSICLLVQFNGLGPRYLAECLFLRLSPHPPHLLPPDPVRFCLHVATPRELQKSPAEIDLPPSLPGLQRRGENMLFEEAFGKILPLLQPCGSMKCLLIGHPSFSFFLDIWGLIFIYF